MFFYLDRVHIQELFRFYLLIRAYLSSHEIILRVHSARATRFQTQTVQMNSASNASTEIMHNYIKYIPQTFIRAKQKETYDSDDSIFYGDKITPVVDKQWERLSF